jgi:hypothetical protein
VPELSLGRIDKSALTIGEPKRLRDKDHLRFVSSQADIFIGESITGSAMTIFSIEIVGGTFAEYTAETERASKRKPLSCLYKTQMI